MPSYWDASGRLVDGRFELSGSKVAEGIADMVLNTQGTLLASAARTAAATSPNQTNYNSNGVILTLNVTIAPVTPGTGGLKVFILQNAPSGATPQLSATSGVLITTTGKYVIELSPGASGGAAGDVQVRTAGSLPRSWFAYVTHADAQSYTYQLDYASVQP